MDNKTNSLKQLETEKLSSLIRIYSLPAIIGMVVNAIYNIVDRIFIGQYVGESALAGLTITFPLTNILFAFALLVGVGSSNLVSNKLGEKNINEASKIFCSAMTYGIILSITLCFLSYIFRENILIILGGTPDILIYAENYLSIILIGFIFTTTTYMLSCNIRAEGRPLVTMVSMSTACIANIIFDYIFIGILDFGVKGAAFATILGQFTGLCIVLQFYFRKQSKLNIKKEYFKLNSNIINNSNKIGFSSFVVSAGNAFTIIVMNNVLSSYGGSQSIAAMSVAFSIQTFVFMPIFGLRQGLTTIMGYNFGAKKIDRVYGSLFLGMKYAFAFSFICFLFIQLFPSFFVELFLNPSSETFTMAITVVRIFFIFLPLYFILFLGLSLFQATERGNLSNILSIARQVLVIPCIFIFPLFIGVYGVYFATIFCDFLSILIALFFIIREYRKDKKTVD